MNSAELEIKDTKESTTSASYLDLLSYGMPGLAPLMNVLF